MAGLRRLGGAPRSHESRGVQRARPYLLPEPLGLADLLPHGVDPLHGGLHLLLLVAELPGHLLLLRAQLGHALAELRELLQGQLALLVGVLQLPGLRLQALGRFNQLLGRKKDAAVAGAKAGSSGTARSEAHGPGTASAPARRRAAWTCA